MRTRYAVAVLMIASGVLLAACGDDNDIAFPTETPTVAPPPTTPPPPPTTPPATDTPTAGTPAVTGTPTPTGGATDTPTQNATPFSFSCQIGTDSSIDICTELACPIVSRPVTDADITFTCTGTQCTAELERFEPVLIGGIGLVCVDPIPPSVLICPTGGVSCEANGPPIDLDLVQNHNIGECGVRDNPNDNTGNADCLADCETECGDRLLADSGCDGYCDSGTRANQKCNLDSECPEGSCNGRDAAPPQDRNVCGCQCLDVGGSPSRAGGIYVQIAAQIIVETESDPNCGSGPILLTLPPQCIALTSERAAGVLLNANNNPGVQIPPSGQLVGQGTPLSCAQYQSGNVDGLNVVSNISFFGSTLGDLEVQLDWICR